ncbi:hypothetical protein [Phytohabitans rumicis]|uniref:hypothetical protein n=1 Tax=Phytohabitans rumicis TaxID=1076125 RepID=UPI0031E5DF21
MLALARRVHRINARELAGVAGLEERERAVLLVALRRTDVRMAARVPASAALVAVGALLAAACLLGPPAVVVFVAEPELSVGQALVGGGAYLTVFGLHAPRQIRQIRGSCRRYLAGTLD